MSDDALPLTVLVPPAGGGPIALHIEAAALTVAVVDRGQVGQLVSDWDTPGVYLLFQRTDGVARNKAYVGKATGLRKRMLGHERTKEGWERAILVARDTRHGFNSAQAGWLEGRLWELVQALPDIELENRQRPTDDTLRAFDLAALEQLILPIERVMRLLGFTQGQTLTGNTADGRPRRTTTRHDVTIAQLLEAGELVAGSQLSSTAPKYPATATIQSDGTIACDGEIHASPSSAGCAVRRGKATNGWTFWRLEDGRTLADVRSAHSAR